MQSGNTGGATAIGSTRRRWPAVLLAFLLGVAMVLVTAAPAAATGPTTDPGEIALNDRFIDWVVRDDTVHLFGIGGDDTSFVVAPGDTVVFGFEFTGGTEADLAAFLTSGDADITLSINGGPANLVNGGYQSPFTAVPNVGPDWSWDHDGDGPGDGNGNSIGDWSGPILFFRFESMPIVGPTSFAFDLGGLIDTITVDAVCEGGVTCDFDDPASNWEASIECDADCTVVVRDPGDSTADIEVSNDTAFELTVIVDKGVGTSPGRATVTKVDSDGEPIGDPLPKCTGRTPTNCVTIIRISGARTQYTVIVDDDPRFRFR